MNDKHTEVPCPSCPLCSLLVSIPEQRVCICYNEWPWHVVTTQSPQLPGGFTLGVVHSACLENVWHISTTVLLYRFWSGFIVLRALLVLYVLPSSLTFLRPPHKFIVSRKAGLSPIFASYFFSHSSSSLQSLVETPLTVGVHNLMSTSKSRYFGSSKKLCALLWMFLPLNSYYDPNAQGDMLGDGVFGRMEALGLGSVLL